MSWGPLQPAQAVASSGPVPAALDPTSQVLLAGNGLPMRWAGHRRFVVLDTAFGLGHHFLATWAAWQQDAQRCDRLSYVAIEARPANRAGLALAHSHSALPDQAAALLQHWPPLTPDMHLLAFDGGRVQLLLAFGSSSKVLPELVAQVNAVYGDGLAPECHPARWDGWRLRQLPRLCAPGATLATRSLAPALQQGLSTAGFRVQTVAGASGQPPMTVADFAPRFSTTAPPGRQALAGVRRVAVVGAGLAGCAVAAALAQRGLAVQLFDRRPGPAQETSGNAGGLFHGVVHGQDGAHARWLRAAALHTTRLLRPLLTQGDVGHGVVGAVDGLLRGEQALSPAAMQQQLHTLALPPDYLQLAPWPGPGPGRTAWHYPGGGWVAPATLCAAWLQQPGIQGRWQQPVQQLRRGAMGWQLLGETGQVLDEADAVLLCNAGDAQRLLGPALAGAPWPMQPVRGQTTLLPAGTPGMPALPQPLADGGYVLRLADGRWLCGATSQADDADPQLRPADHQHNLATLQRLTGWAGTIDPARLDGRVGWRWQSDDRLPLLGPVPDARRIGGGRRADQPRHVPRQPGLYVFTALGARGISQAGLGAELLAAWLLGDPLPVPAALVDALDVARWHSRAVRRAG